MKNIVKFVSLLLVVFMLLPLFSACGPLGSSDDKDTATTYKDEEETKKKKPSKTEAETEAEKVSSGGCGSSVSLAGLALVASLGTCAVFVANKKED